eukprot:TRINITY_DN47440_c0_g1_i1.p1 TRINITY_DN47440_c0_g1~~TRINITY_DN47440_c0_g1_i1.p1  ORF type:complete len:923 (+),score=307.73 TRINITY_DN47440_c0_g1_i1:324-2771(+)
MHRAFMSGVTGPKGSPVAVWYSERQDSKGWLVTQEFMDEATLAAFLARKGDRGRCGVLQSFVSPKPLRNRGGVNHELIVHWASPASIGVERRWNRKRIGFNPDKPASAQHLCVHTCVPVIGKLSPPPSQVTAPFQPVDISTAGEEVGAPALMTVLQPMCTAIRKRIESALTGGATREGLVQQMMLMLKIDTDNRLWFLGIVALRSTGDTALLAPPRAEAGNLVTRRADFELLKFRRGGPGSAVPPSRAQLEAQALSALEREHDAEGRDGEEQNFGAPVDDEGDDPLAARPVAKALRAVRSYAAPRQTAPQTFGLRSHTELERMRHVFVCPNCGGESGRDSVFTTTYRSVVRWYDRQTRSQRRAVAEALSPARRARLQTQCTQSAQQGRDGARSPPVLVGLEGLDGLDEAAFLSQTPEYVTIPPVLQRLARPLDEIRRKAVWLDRQVNLCRPCYFLFYDGDDQADQLRRSKEKEKQRRDVWADRKLWATWNYRPTTADQMDYPLASQMVFTNLQSHHRQIQRRVRRKEDQQRLLQDHLEAVSPAAPAREPELPSPRVRSDDASAPASPRTQQTQQSASLRPFTARSHQMQVPVPPHGRPRGGGGAPNRAVETPPSAFVGRPPGFIRPRFGALSQQADDTQVEVQPTEDEAETAKQPKDEIEVLFKQLEPLQSRDTEMESTVSTVFCNQLFQEMCGVLKYGRPVEQAGQEGPTEDVPQDDPLFLIYSQNRNRIPLPPQLIDITIPLDDPRRIAEKEKASGLTRNRDKVFALLHTVLPIFKELTEDEQAVLLATASELARDREKGAERTEGRQDGRAA